MCATSVCIAYLNKESANTHQGTANMGNTPLSLAFFSGSTMSSTINSSISLPLDDFLCRVFLLADSEMDLVLFSVRL